MMFTQNRDQIRRFYCEVWRKQRDGLLLEPLEKQIHAVIEMHPEYHGLLDQPDTALGREYLPEFGATNPFLHMGLHLALHEQLSTNRPAGIRVLVTEHRAQWPDAHALEHQMMECLAESLWRSQRDGSAPDEAAYLECLRQQLAAPRPRH